MLGVSKAQKTGDADGAAVRIIDTTLREGEQTPGVSFSPSEKKTILAGLVAIGVHEAEIGLSAPLAGRPDDLIRIRYDSHENLVALGVIPGAAPAPRPEAFPGSPVSRYVPDPPLLR